MASTTVAALEEAVFADPRWHARVEQLRKRWMLANEAFHAMVGTTARAQAWVEQNGPSGPSGGDGGHVHAAELVVAKARMRQCKCEAYQLFVDLTGDLLEAISDAHMADDVLITDAETRTAVAGPPLWWPTSARPAARRVVRSSSSEASASSGGGYGRDGSSSTHPREGSFR